MKNPLLLFVVIIMVFSLVACKTETPKSEKYCWSCGGGITKQAVYCEHCGAYLKENDTGTTSKDSTTDESTITETVSSTICDHSWKNATCTTPRTCEKCGVTEGKANGHWWYEATCTDARICTVCLIEDPESEPLGHSYIQGKCERCGDQSDAQFADYDKYIMAAHLYQAVIDCAKFPSSVRIERAYYIDDLGQGYPAVRLECAAANSMGGNGILYGVVIQYPAEDYEDNPYADQIYVYEETYCFECNIYDSCPVLNYNGYEKLDISRIINVHSEDINFN